MNSLLRRSPAVERRVALCRSGLVSAGATERSIALFEPSRWILFRKYMATYLISKVFLPPSEQLILISARHWMDGHATSA